MTKKFQINLYNLKTIVVYLKNSKTTVLKKNKSVLLAKKWRHHPDLNRGIKVLQTLALPLGYVTINMERKTRLELATPTLAR